MSPIAKWKNFSLEEIKEIVASSKSDREVARKLGYVNTGGGSIRSIKNMYKEYNLDTSHFLGQGWNKNNFHYDSFTEYSYKKNGKSTCAALIHLRGRKCEKCGITEWLGQPINLEVHHVNGDRTNNSFENLKLLCPNCHSYTSTFAKPKDKREKTEEEFVNALLGSKSIRQALMFLDLTPSGGNYDRAYYLIDKYNIEHLKKKSRASSEESLV